MTTDDERVVTDPDEVIGLAWFSLDTLAELIREQGIPARVEMTGGNTATLYAGREYSREGEDWTRHTAVAGPGVYYTGPGLPSYANFSEFYVGPDDDGATDAIDADAAGARTLRDLARLIAGQARMQPECLIDADTLGDLGFDETLRSSSAVVAQANAVAEAHAATWNAALHAAYARGATPEEAIAAARRATGGAS